MGGRMLLCMHEGVYEVEEARRGIVCDDRPEGEVAYSCDGCEDDCSLVYSIWGICGVEEENESREGGSVRCELHLLPGVADDRVLELLQCGEIHCGGDYTAHKGTMLLPFSSILLPSDGTDELNDDTQRACPFPRGIGGGHARNHVTESTARAALFSYFSEVAARTSRCTIYSIHAMLPLRVIARSKTPRRSSVRACPFSSPSASRLRPAAPAPHATDYHHPLPPFPSPFRTQPLLNLPSPLPNDISPAPDSPQASLYPSTGVIDSISMISICLRRPEHVPRAYQIFTQLLHDSPTGQMRIPEAKVWAMVIEGVASLGNVHSHGSSAPKWRGRAARLVEQWGEAHGARGSKEPAGMDRDGLRVYQGWFNGLIK